MRKRFLAHGRTPDPATVGLVVFGFSVVSAASGLLLANVALGAVFNIPPPGFVSFPSFPFTYPLTARVEAGSTFIVACAAAFAAAGGLALYARVLSVIWTVVLICLVTGFRTSLPRSAKVGSATTGSWMEETFAPDRGESSSD